MPVKEEWSPPRRRVEKRWGMVGVVTSKKKREKPCWGNIRPPPMEGRMRIGELKKGKQKEDEKKYYLQWGRMVEKASGKSSNPKVENGAPGKSRT